MHKYWNDKRDFINTPMSKATSSGKFHKIKIDPGQLVTPPPGMEYGYVPVQISKDYYDKLHSCGNLSYSRTIHPTTKFQPNILRFKKDNDAKEELWY